MNTSELIQKVRLIEIRTKGLTKHIFSGEYHSSFKGKGMTFSEVRDYQPGDDVRTIDWNVTARFNAPFVKLFEEEREMTVMLLIDLSGSSYFGTQLRTKKELAIELAAVLAFAAESNKDKVGAIFITDRVEKYIAPAKGRKHIQYLLRELIEFAPESKQTDLSEGLRYFRNICKKRSVGFVISDFVSEKPFMEGFRISGRKHDVMALRLTDPADYHLPNLGVMEVYHAETGQKSWVNTASQRVRDDYRKRFENLSAETEDAFKRYGIDFATFDTSSDYIPGLIRLFNSRK